MALAGFFRGLLGGKRTAPPPAAAPKVVVFYDCENVGSGCFDAVMDLARQEGEVVDTRLYGPKVLLGCRSWRSLSARDGDAVRFVTCDGSRSGKNSADIALAVDAVDMAKDSALDVCVLVSADSDYAPLARKLRELGVRVCGAGGVGCNASYASECDSWVPLEASKPVGAPGGRWSKHAGNWDLLDLLERAVALCADDSGWSDLGKVGYLINQIDPGFSVRDCGCSTLKELLREVGEFGLLQRGGSCLARLRGLPRRS